MLRLRTFPENTHLIIKKARTRIPQIATGTEQQRNKVRHPKPMYLWGLCSHQEYGRGCSQLLEPNTGQTGVAQPGLPDRGFV